jgi:hypothetical protein
MGEYICHNSLIFPILDGLKYEKMCILESSVYNICFLKGRASKMKGYKMINNKMAKKV